MEPGDRTTVGEHRQFQGAVCRHARREPAVSLSDEWISNGVRWLFLSVPLYAADRPKICRRGAVFDGSEQQLSRTSINSHEAPRPRTSRTDQLHLESLP